MGFLAVDESRIFWRVILIGLSASLLTNLYMIALYPNESAFPFIPTYTLFQFLFSYQDLGFVRRALIGSLLNLPNDAAFVWQVYVFSIGQYFALLFAMAYWINRHGDPGFAWIFVRTPATFLQLGYDFGRLDALFFLLTAANLVLQSRWPVLLLPIMTLIHEGTIVMFAPLIVFSHVYRFGLTLQLVLSTFAAVCLVSWFAYDTELLDVPVYEVYPSLPEAADILRRSFAESQIFVFEHYRETWQIMKDVPSFLYVHVLAALYILLIMLYVGSWMTPGIWRVLLLSASLTPLLLIPIGIDLGRWGAMSVFNLFLLHLAWARWTPPKVPPVTMLSPLRFTMLWVLFVCGPFAFGRPFPFARRFFYHLHLWLS